jgi:Flp pilus assembly protein TadD
MATVSEALALAVQCHQAGDLRQAEQVYRQILQAAPGHAHVWCLLGAACQAQGRGPEAVACYRQALALQPDYADAHGNLGVALAQQGRIDEASACYREALRLQPDHVQALYCLGVTCASRGQLDEAVACYRRVLALQPGHAQAHYDLGVALMQQGLLDEALAGYEQAVRLQPNHLEAHNARGAVLVRLGRLAEAEESARHVLRLKPDHAGAHNNLGVALTYQGKYAEALADYEQVLRLRPNDPGAHKNRAMVWLLQGDYERGWPEYEWRRRCADSSVHELPRPTWDGGPLAGRTILLHAEQGLGDTLQFIRYAPLVKERGGTVIVECPAPLLPLLAGCPSIDRLVARGADLPPFDVQAPLLSLPALFRTTLASVPASVPYLFAEPGRREHWRRELAGPGFKVGINWHGNPKNPTDRYRTIPLHHFEALAALPGVRLFSLQKGQRGEAVREVPAGSPITDLGGRLDESGAFVDTAAVMTGLDLVITSDTAIPHLAGALGVPVWLPLWSAPDWRWLLEREDSPWYPTLRLFRQSRPGDWEGVFGRIAAALRERVAEK